MKQMTLAAGGFERFGKLTRRAAFLSEMDRVICEHFFGRPGDVALVIDPCQRQRGFFQWAAETPDRTKRTRGFYVFASRHRELELMSFAAYVEGFGDGDGLELARAVERIAAGGRDVVFYKAGRTAEGKHATSGHTASLAGDYDVCEAILRRAGAHLARSFADFLDLVKISSLMGDRRWGGRHLAALATPESR